MRRSLFLLAFVVLAAGCSSGSFIGHRFDNFTAYYNKFYNARRLYASVTKPPDQRDQAIDRTVFLPVFAPPAQAANSKEFQDIVTKSADVLREHPDSKWVDDALLLIGKAYFHQQNYFGAEQKFKEVMSLAGPLDGEARFWLARTLISSGSYQQAYDHLATSLANEDLSVRWEPRLRLTLGELHVKRGEWAEAITELSKGLEDVRGNELRARTQFLLGQIHEVLGEYEEAVTAFNRVEDYKPLYELSYAAKLSAIRVAGQHGDAEWAMQTLRRMERDDKHYNYRAELAFMRGRILHAMGRSDDALATYDDVLYASDANISTVRGRIHYALGELFRDQYKDFILAAAHFDTAATSLRQGASGGAEPAGGVAAAELQFSREAITDVQEQAERFRTFASVRGDIALMDSLLRIGSLDDEAFEAVVLDLRKQRAAELKEQQRTMQRRQAEADFRNASANIPGQLENNDAVTTTAGDNSAAGFLSHLDPAAVQESRMLFIDRWGDRPLVPNWRRVEAIRSVAERAGSGNGGENGVAGTGVSSAEALLPPVDVSAVPRTPEAQAVMRSDRADARYELGNVLFLSMNRPDSAAAWYRMVIEEDGDQPVASRAFYALAEVHRSLGDTLAAHRLYQQILATYPESDFANRVRERLGLPLVERAPTDSLALAEEAYKEAYALWKRGRYAEGIRAMLDCAAQYPSTEIAPRALLAAASAFTEWAQRDSLDLFAEIPLEIPDSLLWASGLARNEVKAQALVAMMDSTAGPADTLATDSLATDSLTVDTIPGEPAALRLEALYAVISSNYPASPYAEQAQHFLEALAERQPAPATDSTLTPGVVPASDSTSLEAAPAPAAIDSATVDSTVEAAGADTTGTIPPIVDEERPGPPLPGAPADSAAVRLDVPAGTQPGIEKEPEPLGTTAPADTMRTVPKRPALKRKLD